MNTDRVRRLIETGCTDDEIIDEARFPRALRAPGDPTFELSQRQRRVLAEQIAEIRGAMDPAPAARRTLDAVRAVLAAGPVLPPSQIVLTYQTGGLAEQIGRTRGQAPAAEGWSPASLPGFADVYRKCVAALTAKHLPLTWESVAVWLGEEYDLPRRRRHGGYADVHAKTIAGWARRAGLPHPSRLQP